MRHRTNNNFAQKMTDACANKYDSNNNVVPRWTRVCANICRRRQTRNATPRTCQETATNLPRPFVVLKQIPRFRFAVWFRNTKVPYHLDQLSVAGPWPKTTPRRIRRLWFRRQGPLHRGTKITLQEQRGVDHTCRWAVGPAHLQCLYFE